MEEKSRAIFRVGHLMPYLLFEIAKDSFVNYENLISEIELLKRKGKFENDGSFIYNEVDKIQTLENQLLKETVKAVVFLSSFLESYFFDFSASALGQDYTEKFIEKIDLKSKIVLVPKLVTGVDLNRELPFWSGISELITWRNKIIHNKTKDGVKFFQNIENFDPTPLYEQFNLKLFFDSVEYLFKELDKIDPKGSHITKLNLGDKTNTQQSS